MEIFDTLLLILAVAGLLVLVLIELPDWVRWLPLGLGLLLVLHLFAEGPRWQMVPAYLGLAFVFVIRAQSPWLRIGAASFSFLLFAISALASWAFPVFELPEPDGPYAVGTTQIEFTDENREESYTEDPDDSRRLMLRVWYPAVDVSCASIARYWEEPAIRSRAVTGGGNPLPWFTFTHLGRVETFSRWEADIADGTFPVVLYSSGLGIGWSSGNTPLAEQLASHGYVVVGIDHTFLGSAAIFPDQVVKFDEATRIAVNTPPPEAVQEIFSQVMQSEDAEEQLDAYMKGMTLMPESITEKVETALRTQVEDQSSVLQRLGVLVTQNFDLAGHIDLSKVGLVGMSLGGSAAVITCERDPMCKAVINLDGFHPDQASVRLSVPSMEMHRPENLLARVNYQSSEALAYDLRIEGATHFNFFDFSMMSPLYARLGVLGDIDGFRMVDIVRRYAVAFFDEALKGGESDLLRADSPAEMPEVRVQRKVFP